MIAGMSITLLIGGSIAVYKSVDLVRELKRSGANVRVVMSKAACQFVTPLTFQTISGNPVSTHLFDEHSESEIGHIALADSADLVLAAPCTADFLAKVSAGLAGDLSCSIILATKSPVLLAPAMNVNMWNNPLTQRNIQTLRDVGYFVLDPDDGDLACGWKGKGRFPTLTRIIDGIHYAKTTKDLIGCRVVVSAGPTREFIDPIRFITNRSTGKMGYSLAREAQWRGADVTLVSGPSHLSDPEGVRVLKVGTAQEMRDVLFDVVAERDDVSSERPGKQFVFMAAAVSDHRPEEASAKKLKKPKIEGYQLSMTPSPDILRELGANRDDLEKQSGRILKLIGFAAETADDEEELIAYGRKKLADKNADLIVANKAKGRFWD